MPYDTQRELLPGVVVRVRDAGHILGSSSVELWARAEGAPCDRRKLVFSGDLGQYDTPILQDPYKFESADLVLMESTYGNRLHRGREDTERELGGILAQAARDGGNVIVPAFAIGRSQELLYLLAKHYGEWHLARWKIFLDSPMAIAASRVYWNNPDRFDEETTRLRESFRGMPPLPNLVLVGIVRRFARHQPRAQRRAHHRRLRHGQRRPRAASPQAQPRAARVPRGHRRLPGAGHAGPAARRSPAGSAHPRPARALPGADPHARRICRRTATRTDLLRWYDSFAGRPPVYLVHGEVPSAEALAVKLREHGAAATVSSSGPEDRTGRLECDSPRLTNA